MVDVLKNKSHLLDLIQVAFVITDVHSKILYANRHTERLFGFTRSEIEGQRIRVLFMGEDLSYLLPNIVYLTIYKNGFEGEVLLKQKDGKKIFAYLHTTSFKEEGEIFLSFSLQEIQRLKKMETERLEMERRVGLGLMVEEVARHVRNPIVSIERHVKHLLKGTATRAKSKSGLEQILRESARLEKIVRQVEEYALIPKAVFKKEQMEEVVESTLKSFSPKATKQGVSICLEKRVSEKNGYLFIDRALVSKALFYVLENSMDAIKRMPLEKKRSTVKVTLFEDEDHIGVSVYDKGEGIPKKNLRHIFEPFFSTRSDRVGLGLTFTKRVVEEEGGRIHLESHVKKWTATTLIFPKDRRRKLRQELISLEPPGKGDQG
jgi:PAS domain S-box-containing protein